MLTGGWMGGCGGDERRFCVFVSLDLKIAHAEQAVELSCSPFSCSLFSFLFHLSLSHTQKCITLMVHGRWLGEPARSGVLGQAVPPLSLNCCQHRAPLDAGPGFNIYVLTGVSPVHPSAERNGNMRLQSKGWDPPMYTLTSAAQSSACELFRMRSEAGVACSDTRKSHTAVAKALDKAWSCYCPAD